MPEHLLKSGGGSGRPAHVVFVDTETYEHHIQGNEAVHRLRLGWACYTHYRKTRGKMSRKWFSFDTPVAFWSWLESVTPRRVSVWVIACNLAFDFTILQGWDFLPAFGARVDWAYFGHGSTMIICHAFRRRFVFLDSINLLPASIKELGDSVDLPKMEVDWRSGDTDLISEYCHRDVEILMLAWNRFCEFILTQDFGRVQISLASQAMSAYRFRFMPEPIHIHHNTDVSKLERKAYFGGRTEAFFVGRYAEHPVWVLDVNSMYPYVMKTNPFPFRLVGSGRHLPLTSLPDKLKRYGIVATVALDTDEPAYPVRDHRTLFPTGRFVTTLTTPELKYALSHGHVREVLAWSDYEMAPLFGSYVSTIMDLRLGYKRDGNKLYSFICKRLANSLYGKFGQFSTEWIDGGYNGCPDSYIGFYTDTSTGEVTTERCLFGWVQYEGETSEARNSFPAIAAHVTSYARMYLYSLIKRAGRRNVLYCDTDSLMVTPKGLENLSAFINADKLGSLKIQDVYEWLEIFAPKDYRSDQVVVLKGVPKTAKKIDTLTYQHELFPGFRTLLREGYTGEYPVRTVTKTLKREYLKGVVGSDGWVSPLTRNDLPLLNRPGSNR